VPAVTLAPGWHTWWIQTRNGSSDGPWSAGMGFTVGTLPSGATLVSPSGPGAGISPTYTWNSVDGATDYYLWVNDAVGSAVVQQWVSAAAACSGATCSAVPAVTLAPGWHTWWIQTRNASGDGLWSAGKGFIVGNPPGISNLVSPSGSGVPPTPTYTWSAVNTATDYLLWVQNASGTINTQTWYQASAVCAGQSCAVTPSTELANGNHTWWVQARNASGEGPWSAGMTFIVGEVPNAPLLVSPSGAGVSTNPSYVWNALAGTTQYYLWVNDATGTVVQDWLDSTAVCGEGDCTFTPPTDLARGPHTWWVQARNASGDGPWSAGMSFVVGQLPDAPVLVSPSGAGAQEAPTYTWQAVSDATDYYLWVSNSSGQAAIQTWLPAATACAGNQCAASPATTLARGYYTWWIQARNPSGDGPWSAGMAFVVGQLPGAPAPVSPVGPTASPLPTFMWTGIEDATAYYLWVNSASGVPVIQRWLDTSNVCTGTDCSARGGQALPSGSYTWWVQARNPSGDGTWSAGLSFTITAAFGSMAAGDSYSLAIPPDGSLWAWGANWAGQLGNGGTENSPVPVSVPGLPVLKAVAGGETHSLAVSGDGHVWSWGANSAGQLGDGSNDDHLEPVQVPGLAAITAVAAGSSHSLALTEDGRVFSWGGNDLGQLGDGTVVSSTTPTRVPGLSNVVVIAAGSQHSLALTQDGTVLAWGDNSSGQLGNGSFDPASSPVPVSGLSAVATIAAGQYHSIAALSDGTAWAWGSNDEGQVGTSPGPPSPTPVQVQSVIQCTTSEGSESCDTAPIAAVTSVAGAAEHSLALKTDGSVWRWGSEVGAFARPVDTLPPIRKIAAAGYHSLALAADGSVWGWGDNASGEVGDGTFDPRGPVQVIGPGFTLPAATPTLSVPGGIYETDLAVVVSSLTPRAVIHYTLDGNDPTDTDPSVSSGDSIAVSTSLTLKARAWAPGVLPGGTASAQYSLEVAYPQLSQLPGTYSAVQQVAVVVDTPGASVHYTTNGQEPTESDRLLAPGATITIDRPLWLWVRAFKPGWLSSSTGGYYDVNFGTLSPPVMTPAGGIGVGAAHVSLAATPGATIRYSLDGSTPGEGSPEYTGPLTIEMTTTLKARAFQPGWTDSNTAAATFTVYVARPVVTPASGVYASGQVITVTSPTTGTQLRYTTNGSDPTDLDATLTSGGTLPMGSFRLKVKAWKYGALASVVSTTDFMLTTDPNSDADHDGLTLAQELFYGTDPLNPDTNGDGIPDGASVALGISPTSLDVDGDGLTNATERRIGTDPLNPDTDGDGVPDGADCFPLDPTRWQCPIPDPTDHTPPSITVLLPTNARLVSSIP